MFFWMFFCPRKYCTYNFCGLPTYPSTHEPSNHGRRCSARRKLTYVCEKLSKAVSFTSVHITFNIIVRIGADKALAHNCRIFGQSIHFPYSHRNDTMYPLLHPHSLTQMLSDLDFWIRRGSNLQKWTLGIFATCCHPLGRCQVRWPSYCSSCGCWASYSTHRRQLHHHTGIALLHCHSISKVESLSTLSHTLHLYSIPFPGLLRSTI